MLFKPELSYSQIIGFVHSKTTRRNHDTPFFPPRTRKHKEHKLHQKIQPVLQRSQDSCVLRPELETISLSSPPPSHNPRIAVTKGRPEPQPRPPLPPPPPNPWEHQWHQWHRSGLDKTKSIGSRSDGTKKALVAGVCLFSPRRSLR